MFERYTEKARRVIFFARYEASKFGSPYIESEFVLLGMLRETKQVVTRWLGEGDWETILRDEVEKNHYAGAKISTSVDLPLSEEAKRVLAYAAEEADLLKHQYIGSEHLFLGLLRDSKSRAAKLLLGRGVNLDTVRQTLAREGALSGVGTGSGRAGVTSGIVQGRSLQVLVIPEDSGRPVHVLWGARVPMVGEVITFNNDEGGSSIYQVIKIEWNTATSALGSHSLTKVLVHVRGLKSSE
jgi:hypothetical protein